MFYVLLLQYYSTIKYRGMHINSFRFNSSRCHPLVYNRINKGGFIKRIAIPTDGVQHARLAHKTEMIGINNCAMRKSEVR